MKPDPPYIIHPPGSHRPIVDAVLAGDPEAAVEAMRNHVLIFYENLVNLEKDYRKHVVLSD